MVGGDDRLELTRTTASEIVVLGYGGEPYLRLDAEGNVTGVGKGHTLAEFL